jgi:hypothetical protein
MIQYTVIFPPVVVLIVNAISPFTFKTEGTLPGIIDTGTAFEYSPRPAAFNPATLNEYRNPFVKLDIVVITALVAPLSDAVRIASLDTVNELCETIFHDASGTFSGIGNTTPDGSVVKIAYFIEYAYGTYVYGVGTIHDNLTFLPPLSGMIVGNIVLTCTLEGGGPIRENTTLGNTTVIESGSNSSVFVIGAGFEISLVPRMFDDDI